MKSYLTFTLYGPLQAWGDIAVGEVRSSARHPTKSAILGLIAAALGIKREDEARHQKLAKDIGYAVRIDSPGHLLVDYHTAQVPSRQRNTVWRTRKDELAASGLNTVLSTREYLTDGVFTVALWSHRAENLKEIERALIKPAFTLYLGRKSCPLALPLKPETHTAQTAVEALSQPLPKAIRDHLSGLLNNRAKTIIYTEEALPTHERATRWDQPSSRARWTFEPRFETRVVLPTNLGEGQ